MILFLMTMQEGFTALMLASQNGHSNVVNRLLECKQIDVNLQAKVSRMLVHPLFFNILFNISFV